MTEKTDRYVFPISGGEAIVVSLADGEPAPKGYAFRPSLQQYEIPSDGLKALEASFEQLVQEMEEG